MLAHRRKHWFLWFFVLIGGVVGCLGGSPSFAANISEFVNIRPYAELEGGFDDNLFGLSEDAELPEDAEDREDSYIAAGAGVIADITFERRLLNLGIGLDYNYTYKTYSNNSYLDAGENDLTFELSLSSQYESKGLFNDRVKFSINDVLDYIPVNEEKPLLEGNRTWKNSLMTGVDYNLISKPRTAFILGYTYSRIDYGDDPITIQIGGGYDSSDELMQESQTHRGRASFKHALNSKLFYVLDYVYDFTMREEKARALTSADFTRQNVTTGVQAKLTPKIHASINAGYSMTSYDDVDGLSQDDQDSVVGEASLTGNFNHRPLMTLGYKRYYTENDFGDTLLSDDVFARLGFKIAQGFIVTVTGDYILEDRDLFDDDTKQTLFGVDTEYELVKNLKVMLGYTYRDKDFFEYNFLAVKDREETTHEFSGGLEYKLSRYFLLKGMYYYTDKSSNVDTEEYSRNKFVASGRVIF
ncbi:hypothetical protein CSA56_10460 [candidate division KSB3 bacterium]|uniref:Outer membrane protein beta-barrel domain-containing protein n=1 Tax=candidate division KSB3 bacterium TaxID=2044937 RepID=A0A2G6KG08_9BACT|nr:MAG: hypothetical protein CSA56_10460 [candidate division KSB3 bacterium]